MVKKIPDFQLKYFVSLSKRQLNCFSAKVYFFEIMHMDLVHSSFQLEKKLDRTVKTNSMVLNQIKFKMCNIR